MDLSVKRSKQYEKPNKYKPSQAMAGILTAA